MKLVLDNIELKPGMPEKELGNIISQKFKIPFNCEYKILKRSLDARKKKKILYRYRLAVEIPDHLAECLLEHGDVTVYSGEKYCKTDFNIEGKEAIIVGAGPAGLFCALRIIESGGRVKLIERGKPVEERIGDIRSLREGILNPESNVLFGEGGAGAFSDGKLYTRINREETKWFFDKMVGFGAPGDILYDARPHIGTDRLMGIIKEARKKILSSGSEIYFNEKLVKIIESGGSVKGIATASGRELRSPVVVLALGHSARDTFEILQKNNIALEKKGFAVGVRVEHPAELINSIQYGNSHSFDSLPAAEYTLTYNNTDTGRGTYSFCMCPGGEVINSSSAFGGLCTNGMSNSKRNSPFSNSALVVTIHADDTAPGPLSGVYFQKEIESLAYNAGGGGFVAPAQTVNSFLKQRIDSQLPASSYMPGLRPASLEAYLPEWITSELRDALHYFNKKMKGFVSPGGIMIGAETRTSSPVRILRNEGLQSVSMKGLFPIGEGSGYAGGIVSSAVDGIRAADKIAELLSKKIF